MVPDAFNKFAIGFIQGSSRDHATMSEWIRSALLRLDPGEKKSLKCYVDGLLRDNVTEDRLLALWSKTSADYFVHVDGSMRGFLAVVSEESGKQL